MSDDEFTELVDAEFGRVDLVGKGANGLRFLIAKAQDDGLLRPDVAEVALAKADAPTPTRAEGPFGDNAMPENPDVAKADGELVEDVADLDVTEVLAEPDVAAPGDPNVPASPAWEAVDAATALKWTTILSRAKNAVTVLAERESVEAASQDGDPDDAMNAWDLDDACCAIDYAISVLAPFAVGEANEVALQTEELEAVFKAATDLSDDDVAVVEAYTAVAKAGRVLSAANEALINGAAENLQKVLASLPSAPVAKETEMPDTDDVEKGSEPVDEHQTQDETYTGVEDKKGPTQDDGLPDNYEEASGSDDVSTAAPAGMRKAKGDPQVAVYDENGNLVGVVDSTDITPLASASSDATPDLEPAPAQDVGVPAADVATAPAPVVPAADTAVAKEQEVEITKESLEETKQALAAQAEVLKSLGERLHAWESAPAASRVLTNGAPVPMHLLRGQNHSTAPTNPHIDDLRVRLEKATSAEEREHISNEMNQIAAEALGRVHATRR